MKVTYRPPLDFFEDATLTLAEWLDKSDPQQRIQKMATFMKSVVAVSRHPVWEWDLRCEPRVAYNPALDDTYFIFKIDNNGSTFLVGDSLPLLNDTDPEDTMAVDV